jgi:hypothetical protein
MDILLYERISFRSVVEEKLILLNIRIFIERKVAVTRV